MIQDSQLEFNPQWDAIANEGIGGPVPYVAPKIFTAVPATAANPFLAVTIEGSSYTDMMAATHRPLMPAFFANQIFYSFSFEVTPDTNNKSVQAFEFEACYCDENQYYYNNSMQLNYVNPANMVQAYASPTNVWANTGITVPQFTASVSAPVKVNYMVNPMGRTMSTLSVEIGGKVYPLPASFQNIPGAVRAGWAPGVYVQFQLDLAALGGAVTNKFSNVSIDWL
jgi:hypothetical protein